MSITRRAQLALERWYHALALAVLLLAPSAAGETIRVDPQQVLDETTLVGDSWPAACRTLQRALEVAEEFTGPDTIWLADGTYLPTAGASESSVFVSFRIDSENQPV